MLDFSALGPRPTLSSIANFCVAELEFERLPTAAEVITAAQEAGIDVRENRVDSRGLLHVFSKLTVQHGLPLWKEKHPLVAADQSKFPSLEAFGFSALLRAAEVSMSWGDNSLMKISEISRVYTVGSNGMGTIVDWVSHHNGNGDFVSISGINIGSRLLVNFEHESDRNTCGDEPQVLAPGLEWIEGYNRRVLATVELSTPQQLLATSVYRTAHRHVSENDPDSYDWCSSQTVVDLEEDFSSYGQGPYLWNEDAQAFQMLFDRYMAGENPSHGEIAAVVDDELVASAVHVTAARIRQWAKSDRW